uniref:UMOD/GP2/OIT3-like D8C domain-containing protein n=1 Tax=Astyanax mexicanus TaxID=7994 RepID=A0A8B9HKA7_ASTMX
MLRCRPKLSFPSLKDQHLPLVSTTLSIAFLVLTVSDFPCLSNFVNKHLLTLILVFLTHIHISKHKGLCIEQSKLSASTGDPCYFYTTLDQPWRATNGSKMSICDNNFNWKGWYRLMYNGMNIRMPEICTTFYRCGTYITFWLNGSHPQISDGIITRQACGKAWNTDCCGWSVLMQVKACPGNYYVYEFIKPNICYAAYCSGTQIHSKSF